MRLIRGILSVVAHVLLTVVVIAGIGCAAYSYAAQKASQAAGQAGEGLGQVLSTLGAASRSAVEGLLGGSASAGTSGGTGDASGQTASSTPSTVAQYAGQVAQAFGLASGGDLTAGSFDDPELGAAYLQWKDGISSPVDRVFAGTSITRELIEGVAGGSVTATQALAELDDATLATVASNASSLSATAANHAIPSSLPQGVQADMRDADAHCRAFCDQVQAMVAAAGKVRAGDVLAVTSLTGAAGSADAELKAMDESMSQAEGLLGA
jgi:hypothetical protein